MSELPQATAPQPPHLGADRHPRGSGDPSPEPSRDLRGAGVCVMEPRAIDPKDIRVGDRVRLTQDREFTVTQCKEVGGWSGGGFIAGDPGHTWGWGSGAWTLLDRPEPLREPWSRWLDPETGTEYARTDETSPVGLHYVPVVCKQGVSREPLCPTWGRDAEVIARLVPLDGAR